MLTIYLIGFLFTFVLFWMFLAQKDYKESTDMFCSLVFSFTWPLWFIGIIVAAFTLIYKKLTKHE